MYRFARLLSLVAGTALFFAAFTRPVVAQEHQHDARGADDVGRVAFPTSCAAAVQPDLERAVAMLHSFWYEKAEAAFIGIAARDPECAMAHWGAAMSVFRPLWQPSSPAELQRGGAAAARKSVV